MPGDNENTTIAIIVIGVIALLVFFYFLNKNKPQASVAVANADGKTIDKTSEGFPVIPDPNTATDAQREIVKSYVTTLDNYM